VKPAAFRYERPDSIEETVSLLAEHGDEAKVLAGGQSLVPMMNFRLARPAVVVDLDAVPGLDTIVRSERAVAIGAMVRHRALEQPEFDGPLGALVAQAAHHVGHLPIRLRGTFGGSIAHADPAAEWCLVARVLNAEVSVRSVRGERAIGAADLFETVFTTTIADDELLTEVRLPMLTADWSTGFSEFSRRAGDFAVVAVATAVRHDAGLVAEARIAAGGVAGTPVRLPAAEATLLGRPLDAAAVDDAAEAGAREVDPTGDIHGSSSYRRDLVRALTRRALS
jgi:carbon-monoxide dehydrogenase medium subunit